MNEEGIKSVTDLIRMVKAGGGETFSVTITARQRQLTTFISTVTTHTEYRGYRYYRNRGNNDHMVREGNDQSINYFARTVVKLLNNCFKRQETFAFFSAYGKVIFQRYEGKYYLNGNKLTKTRLNSCVPGILMKLAISKDEKKFSKFVDMIIETDPKSLQQLLTKLNTHSLIMIRKLPPFSI